MRKLTTVFCSALVPWLANPAALAQSTIDVLGSGSPQPVNTFGCPKNPKCISATFDTSSNSPNEDITAPIQRGW